MKEIYGASLVYVPSKSKILLIGGIDHTQDKMIRNVRSYCMKSKKWRIIEEVNLEKYLVSTILTANEKYVIISGGKKEKRIDGRCYTDDIYILDIRDDENYKLYRKFHKNTKSMSSPNCTMWRITR